MPGTVRMYFRGLAVGFAVLIFSSFPSPAAALDGVIGGQYAATQAAGWARNHWNDCGNDPTWPCFGNDCANFVSTALWKGGVMFRDVNPDPTYYKNWYVYFSHYDIFGKAQYDYSTTWPRVKELGPHLKSRGAAWQSPKPGGSTAYDSGGGIGDLLFYDWNGDGIHDHVGIITNYGNTSDGLIGDGVTYHTVNRLNIHWTAKTYNENWMYTKVTPLRID